MYIENIAELAESIYFKVLQELSLDDLDSGFIKLDDDGLGTTENTERGRDLYYAIEAELESYFNDGNAKWVTKNIPAVLDNEFRMSGNMAEYDCQELQELIDELEQKIEGEGCEETCKKYRKEIEELSIQLKEIEELIND